MTVEFNHTIVHSGDDLASARFLAELLDLPEPTPFGPFQVVALSNSASLDFLRVPGPITGQHYAFKLSEAEFDAVYAKIRARGITHWADPFHQHPNEINTRDGGRGVYFDDPNGHNMEILTEHYGEYAE
ncbi:VOC family protein [Actinokineospora enzanensis]|uniref:VOC family protein n=1 Tax=Actinokineospora enzanensis TaxID=155975 RepID=UPI00035C143E|nr:VOC family protein [Actinokineospora enzanensis]